MTNISTSKNKETVYCHETGKDERVEDIVFYKDRVYLKNGEHIVEDFISNTLELKNTTHKVISDFKIEDGEIKKVSYLYTRTPDKLSIISLNSGKEYWIKDAQTAIANGLKEDYKSGYFYQTLPKKSTYKCYEKFNHIKERDYEHGGKSRTYLVTEGKKYTFGLEIETSIGVVPERVAKNLNWECVHDGSLRNENGEVTGGEYVTGVLTGDSGILQLQQICFELSRRCRINSKCSVHVHIGDIDFNKEFIVFSYYVSQLLEDELFSMLAPSRRDNTYCRKMKHIKFNFPKFKSKSEYKIYIDEKYNEIYAIISGGKLNPSENYNKKTEHPLGHKCGYNHKSARYWWINFVPAMFNTRGNNSYTLEIRSHSATTNFLKIKNWLLICMGYLYFCENHKNDIINGYVNIGGKIVDINLETIMKIAYPKRSAKIIDYIRSRKSKFSKSSNSEQEEYDNEEETVKTNIKELI